MREFYVGSFAGNQADHPANHRHFPTWGGWELRQQAMKISRNVFWNAVGIAVPLFVGLVATPKIVNGLGVERFGVLSIIWMMIGYFSVFDLGLGRTLTKLVAERLHTRAGHEIPQLVSTTLVIVGLSGAILGVATAASAGWISSLVLHASATYRQETAAAIVWLAVSLPFVLLATALFGLLEAFQEFALISAVRLPIGILSFIAPLAVLPFSKRLDFITAALASVRVVTTAVLLLLAYRILPSLWGRTFKLHRELVRSLVAFGGWLTVSNVVGPIMTYFDRFLIAAVAGSATVAYYTIPYDVLMRLLVFSTAIAGVLFPTFVALRRTDTRRLQSVFAKSSEATLLLMGPALLAVMLLGHEALTLWIGAQFAEKSARVAELLMMGVLMNAMARIPYAFIQSAGYANWTAITHLIELPAYVLGLWWLLAKFGIAGAAFAWTARVFIDTVVFYALSVRIERGLLNNAVRDVSLIMVICIFTVILGWIFDGMVARLSLAACCAIACGIRLLWRFWGALPFTRIPTKTYS